MPIPRMGVERIPFNSIDKIDEIGPSGENVFVLDNKDSRIRFVGDFEHYNTGNHGGTIYAPVGNSAFAEITFYGTGLNAMMYSGSGGDYRATVDGGVEGANFYINSSTILSGRSYKSNVAYKVASGLSLGWHTIKIRIDDASGLNLNFFGVEILNDSAQISVPEGSAFSGTNKFSNPAAVLEDYKAGITGTKGGRVSWYIHEGIVKSAFTEVDATPKYLALADHSNEEEVKRYNFREFGANRADDFSTLAGQRTAAFTLDDGVTTLVGNEVQDTYLTFSELIYASGIGHYYTLTFVGTGLDIVEQRATNVADTDLYIDGTLIGSIPEASGLTPQIQTRKICSGLAYGTHTLKIVRTSANASFMSKDFIVYQPKTPEQPTNAVSLGSYNVVADYVANSTQGLEAIGQGLIRKDASREFVYASSWTTLNFSVSDHIGGHEAYTTTATASCSYTFFGTGLEMRWRGTVSLASSVTVDIDGSTNHSSLTTSVYGAGIGFTAATGILDQTSTSTLAGCGLSISGLPLGLHTITFTANTPGAGGMWIGSMDIITPIHSHSEKGIGSLSLDYNKEIQPVISENPKADWSKAKALLIYDQVNNKIIYSKNVKQVLDFGNGQDKIYFEKCFKDDEYVGIPSTEFPHTFTHIDDKHKSYCSITSGYYTTVYGDRERVHVAFFGELEGEE